MLANTYGQVWKDTCNVCWCFLIHKTLIENPVNIGLTLAAKWTLANDFAPLHLPNGQRNIYFIRLLCGVNEIPYAEYLFLWLASNKCAISFHDKNTSIVIMTARQGSLYFFTLLEKWRHWNSGRLLFNQDYYLTRCDSTKPRSLYPQGMPYALPLGFLSGPKLWASAGKG